MQIAKDRKNFAAVSLTALGALVRLIPHPWNFTPIGATGLFAGERLRGWQAYAVPLVAMAVTDPIASWVTGGYPAYSSMTLVVYASLAVYVLLGQLFLRSSQKPARVAAVCVAGGMQFFLVTNFFVWLGAKGLYPHTFAGLLACYTAALPFFAWTVMGDLFYIAALNLAYLFVARRIAGSASRVTI